MTKPEWMPEAAGFAMRIGTTEYRAARFPVGSGKRGRYGAWADGRLIGDAPKLIGAQTLCEREAARVKRGARKLVDIRD